MAKKPDWKKIAEELGQRVTFAVSYLNASRGPGLILNTTDHTTRHWKEWFADGLEQVPWISVDRELMYADTKAKRKKLYASRKLFDRRSAT